MSSLPARKFFRRERFEEFGSDYQLPFQDAELTTALAARDWNQPNDGVLAAGNNDLFASACFFDEPGKAGFGFVNAHGFHIS
ncbi:MAG TPA: hypothetical protein VKF84_16855 [Candidatus Sulfotelmatobacter sp.]|nr:hypothetical protein [Candidatus Sulfotelmatobacter sp.]